MSYALVVDPKPGYLHVKVTGKNSWFFTTVRDAEAWLIAQMAGDSNPIAPVPHPSR